MYSYIDLYIACLYLYMIVVCLFNGLSFYLPVYWTYLPWILSIHLSIYPSIHPSIQLSISPSFHLSLSLVLHVYLCTIYTSFNFWNENGTTRTTLTSTERNRSSTRPSVGKKRRGSSKGFPMDGNPYEEPRFYDVLRGGCDFIESGWGSHLRLEYVKSSETSKLPFDEGSSFWAKKHE